MSGWGTQQQQEAERARLQQEQLRRQEEANRQRLADMEAKRRAEEARQREYRERNTALMEGAAGKRSHRSVTHSGDYMLGAALGGRDPVTGQSRYDTPQTTGGGMAGAGGAAPVQVPVKRRLEQIWDTSIYIVIALLIYGFASSVGIVDYVKAQVLLLGASAGVSAPAQKTVGGIAMSHQVTADKLNIRRGPGVAFQTLGTLPRGSCVAVVGGVSGEWTSVMVSTNAGPEMHYAASAYLAPLAPGTRC